MFLRKEQDNLLKLLKNSQRNIIIIEGARQVGKTTLVSNILENYPKKLILNLETDLLDLKEIDSTESFEDFSLYLAHQYNFKDEPNAILFIDEAQESKNLGKYVRSFKEKWKHIKVILSGSSMTRLFRDEQRIPVGRFTKILITPLSFLEFIQAKKCSALVEELEKFSSNESSNSISQYLHNLFLETLDEYLLVGGLPGVVADYINQADWRRTRINLFLSQEEDFIRKSGIKNKDIFTAALKGISNNLGSPSKYTHISDKQYEAKNIINLLKEWKLIYEVPQRGIATTSSFYPKRYIYDIGISQDLREHPFPNISILKTLASDLRTPLGGLLENALLLQFIGHPSVYNISSWKNSSDENKEVDFVIKSELTIPIECKSALKFSARNFYGLKQYLKLSSQETGFLISLAPYQTITEDGLRLINLPFYLADFRIISSLLK